MMLVMDWAVDRAPASLSAISAPQMITPSPTIDALGVPRTPNEASRTETRLVKVGQTALHNPGGRSSWIRL